MHKQEFINRIRSLYNIDGHLLPELSSQQQLAFLRAPVTYFLETDESQSDAIMREIERRQNSAVSASSSRLAASSAPAVGKAMRARKAKPKIEGQGEMLLPIPGGKTADAKAAGNRSSSTEDNRENVSFRRAR
jgi:hypothetical protein